MVDTAARLVDEVLPDVPVRQFVLSLPFEIRYRVAWDGKLICGILAVFLRVSDRLVWPPGSRARLPWGSLRLGDLRAALWEFANLNPHFHVLFLDGVYVPAADGGAPVFVAASLSSRRGCSRDS
jgi:hypothetical protein